MGHPLIDEFCRIHGMDNMRPEFFRRCQRTFREEVQPQLDERDRLLEDNAALKRQVEKLTPKAKKSEAVA